MITANNGILICALLMWLGVDRSPVLIAAALAVAGLSYIANVLGE